ncbi:hypothetical protein IAE40_07970 [Pseudomonas sp. S44]|uniref:hypothetical protein n=1 Tax=Pseudomonas sp. S44 TaxID=2767450 RepID=UPI00190DFE68|nr:hypothetical protein [Pseudomonas sp. S44]MBK0058570.1 hypothetical protein [Pseudomonas sp. S44]
MKDISRDAQETLLSLYREREAVNNLWHDKQFFSEILTFALSAQANRPAGTEVNACANYFINHTLVFLIDSSETLITLLKSIAQKPLRATLISQWISNELVALSRISDFAQYEYMSALAKISDTDTEIIAKLSARHLIRQAEPNSLSLSNLTPAHLNLSRHLQEYLISWAYEEEKLDECSVSTFEREHPKKYSMLKKIKTQNP